MTTTKFLNGLCALMSASKIRNYKSLFSALFFLFWIPFIAFGEETSYSALFKNYPSEEYYKGSISAIDLNSDPHAFQFRSRLESGLNQGPNFSGSFCLIEWGCGISCTQIAILDVKTGKICDWAVTCGLSEYRLNSNLLIINPGANENQGNYPEGCSTEFYLFKNSRLHRLIQD